MLAAFLLVSFRMNNFLLNYLFQFCSVVTGPFYTIGLAMQLSVIPHLTIYGDVKPE
jgi:hypothetical protein